MADRMATVTFDGTDVGEASSDEAASIDESVSSSYGAIQDKANIMAANFGTGHVGGATSDEAHTTGHIMDNLYYVPDVGSAGAVGTHDAAGVTYDGAKSTIPGAIPSNKVRHATYHEADLLAVFLRGDDVGNPNQDETKFESNNETTEAPYTEIHPSSTIVAVIAPAGVDLAENDTYSEDDLMPSVALSGGELGNASEGITIEGDVSDEGAIPTDTAEADNHSATATSTDGLPSTTVVVKIGSKAATPVNATGTAVQTTRTILEIRTARTTTTTGSTSAPLANTAHAGTSNWSTTVATNTSTASELSTTRAPVSGATKSRPVAMVSNTLSMTSTSNSGRGRSTALNSSTTTRSATTSRTTNASFPSTATATGGQHLRPTTTSSAIASTTTPPGCVFDKSSLPTTPYVWDPTRCYEGSAFSLGCKADGIHQECRFCGEVPYAPCPEISTTVVVTTDRTTELSSTTTTWRAPTSAADFFDVTETTTIRETPLAFVGGVPGRPSCSLAVGGWAFLAFAIGARGLPWL